MAEIEMNATHNTTAPAIWIDIARLRWPEYAVTGSGRFAVVLHCCRKVILCDNVLEGRLTKNAHCGAACRIDEDPRWHRGVALDEVRQEAPHRSFCKLPGWDED